MSQCRTKKVIISFSVEQDEEKKTWISMSGVQVYVARFEKEDVATALKSQVYKV